MLLNKKVLSVGNAASTEPTRYTINGILIEPDGSAVACDGHILVKFTPTPESGRDPAEYPTIEGMSPMDGLTVGQIDENSVPTALVPFILSNDSIAQIRKALPKRTRMPVLDTIALDAVQTNANGHAVMAVTDLETTQVLKPKKIDGQFPDYAKVIPEYKENTVKVGFTLEVFEKMLKTLKSLDVKTFSLEIKDATGPVRIEATTKDSDGQVLAVIMPCRLKD